MKKVLSVLLTLMLVVGLCPAMAVNAAWDGVAATEFAGGSGVKDDPWLISNAAQLKLASDTVNGGDTDAWFRLTADIDYENNVWDPIGYADANSFIGNFDGGCHVVKNLQITQDIGIFAGFFGGMNNAAVVQNLGLENVTANIAATNNVKYLGVFAGNASGYIGNCYVANSTVVLTGGWAAGAFAASTRRGANFTNSYVYNVKINKGGAFVGQLEGTTSFTNCYTAEVKAADVTDAVVNFGFGNKKTATATVSNSYKTLNMGGTNDIAATEADKEDIVDGLVTNLEGTAYTTHDSVNDGYPCFTWQLWNGETATAFAGGSGTAADPYLISNAAQLKLASTTGGASHYKLMADIDYMNNEWTPINLSASFNGNCHVIRNVKITEKGNIGFFGTISDSASITNLGIENMTVEADVGSSFAGIFAGRAGGTITGCYVANSSITNTGANATYGIGGFAGSFRQLTKVTNCYVYNVAVNSTATDSNQSGFAGKFESNNTVSYANNCYVAEVTINNGGASTACGFIKKSGNNTASNSYTTIDAPNRTNDVVPAVSSKSAIVDGLVTNLELTPYTVSANINDGYPCLAWQVWDGTAATAFAGGSGVKNDPWLISNAAQLKLANDKINVDGMTSTYYALTADIDYLNNEWMPIGNNAAFAGGFLGNGHAIKNVKITQNYTYCAFFGQLANGSEINGIGLENITINMNRGIWSGIFACCSRGTIMNCYVKNSSLKNPSSWATGAFVAAPSAGNPQYFYCYVYNVKLDGAGAGFAGKMESGAYFGNCYAAGVTSNAGTLYNFIHNINGKESLVNKSTCWSDVASTTATSGDVTVGTKEEIKNALVTFDANCAYKVNSKINAGYPSFTSEKAAKYDNEYEVTMLSTADGIKARIETNEAVDGATVYVATYDGDGRLIAAEALDADTIVTSTLSANGAETIKVFVWDANCNKLATAFVK